MRKLTKASLSELAESKEIISFREQKSYVGGGTGEAGNPFTYQEFLSQINSNQWAGGYVLCGNDTNGQISYNGGTISIYIGSDLAKYGGGTQIPGAEGYSGGTDYSGGTNYVEVNNDGWDVEKALKKLHKGATGSKGFCARAVMNAIEAGGEKARRAESAHLLNNGYLENTGFQEVSKKNYVPQKGDVIVLEATNGHPYGHTAMYDGRQWVSDFYQRDAFGSSAYRKPGVEYHYYRHK